MKMHGSGNFGACWLVCLPHRWAAYLWRGGVVAERGPNNINYKMQKATKSYDGQYCMQCSVFTAGQLSPCLTRYWNVVKKIIGEPEILRQRDELGWALVSLRTVSWRTLADQKLARNIAMEGTNIVAFSTKTADFAILSLTVLVSINSVCPFVSKYTQHTF